MTSFYETGEVDLVWNDMEDYEFDYCEEIKQMAKKEIIPIFHPKKTQLIFDQHIEYLETIYETDETSSTCNGEKESIKSECRDTKPIEICSSTFMKNQKQRESDADGLRLASLDSWDRCSICSHDVYGLFLGLQNENNTEESDLCLKDQNNNSGFTSWGENFDEASMQCKESVSIGENENDGSSQHSKKRVENLYEMEDNLSDYSQPRSISKQLSRYKLFIGQDKSCYSTSETHFTTKSSSSQFSPDLMFENVPQIIVAPHCLEDEIEENDAIYEVGNTDQRKRIVNILTKRLGTSDDIVLRKMILGGCHEFNDQQLEIFIKKNLKYITKIKILIPNDDEMIADTIVKMMHLHREYSLKNNDKNNSQPAKIESTAEKEATVMEIVGNLYQEKGNNEKALQAFIKAFELRKRSFKWTNVLNVFTSALEEKKSSSLTFANTANKIGILLEEAGRYNEAKERFYEALSKQRDVYGSSHINVAIAFCRIAAVDFKLDDDKSALMNYKKALLIFEHYENDISKHENKWKEYISTLSNMGQLYHRMKNKNMAIQMYEKELKMIKKYAPKARELEHKVYHRLGLLYRDYESYDEALIWFLKGLSILEETDGDEDTLLIKRDVADCYYAMEMNLEGIKVYTDIVDKVDPEHKVSILNKLSILYARQNQYCEALQHCVKARLICSSMRNANIKDTLMTYNNLGNIYSELGEVEKAQKCYNKAQKIWKREKNIFSQGDGEESGILYNMGVLYFKQGSLKQANECFIQFLELHTPIDATDISNRENIIKVANALNNVGNIHSQSRDYTSAISFYHKSLNLKISLYGKDSAKIFGTQCNIGTVYFEVGRLDLAKSIFEKVMQKMEESGTSGLLIARIHDKLGNISMARNDYDNALEYYNKALHIKFNNLSDKSHEDILITHYNIALVLCRQKHFTEAVGLLLDIRKEKRSKLGEYHPFMAKITLDVANIYLKMERIDEAESYYLIAMKTLELAHIRDNHPYFRHSQKTLKKINSMKAILRRT